MYEVIASLSRLDGLEELYEVTGEFDVIVLLSSSDIEQFRDRLKNKIMKIKGIKSTVSSIVLKTYKSPNLQENVEEVNV